jgi:hypothetical protein
LPANKKAHRLTSVDKKAQKEKEVSSSRDEDTACVVCTRTTNAKKMLLCDKCDKGWHMKCMSPPMTVVPEGDWFCVECKALLATESEHSK